MTDITSDEQDALDMARLREGHDGALGDLMRRHGERLFHYLIRQVQSEAEACDLAQEAFLRVYQNRAKFDSRRGFPRGFMQSQLTSAATGSGGRRGIHRSRWTPRMRDLGLRCSKGW